MTRRLGIAFALALGLLAAAAPPSGAQCAMCQTALTGSPEGRRMAHEFNKAILVMLAAPYLVFGGFALVVFRRRILGAIATRARRLRPAH